MDDFPRFILFTLVAAVLFSASAYLVFCAVTHGVLHPDACRWIPSVKGWFSW